MNIKVEKQIIVGAGCEGTNETINLCNSLYGIGADAALIYTPHFFRNQMTDNALINHYKRVADHSKLPIILYNVPSNTGVELSFEVASKLSSHSNIIGIKDSGGNIKKLGDIVEATKKNNFQVLAGSAGFLADAMEIGCVGGICALANVLPEKTIEIFDLMRNGRVVEAKVLQGQLCGPNTAVTRKHGVPGLKHMLDYLGYYGGPVRGPLLPLGSKEKEEIEKEFASFHSKIMLA
uniref:4-hydroxy-2-oxoglutarate aldolase, mitochondrial n=1 Tax=Romanomermis culicivorax TaxID=13658 RepID=A0A915L6N3_ROMCU